MSGGSWDYVYRKLEDLSEELIDSGLLRQNAYRQLLGEHVERIAKIMYTIEWIDSGDYGEEEVANYQQAIVDLLGREAVVHFTARRLQEEIRAAEQVWDAMKDWKE